MPASWMLDELSLRTRTYHAEADLVHLRLFAGAVDAGSYCRALVRLLGFQRQVVDALATEPLLATVRPEQRVQLAALLADLKWLGVEHDELPDHEPATTSPAYAFGWCYVAERMALWSTLVTRRLRTRLAPEVADGAMTFLTGRVNASPLRWTVLGGLLDRGAAAYSAGDIVAGARESFEAARRWCGSFPTRAQVGAA